MISDEMLNKFIENPSDYGPAVIAMAKELQAYRQEFSEPFCFTDIAGVELCLQGTSFEAWPQIDAVIDSIPLYRKPTIPE
ncbi:hypothetical protein [Pantoea stewartii]|uniref:Uncharacterized protein n=1 Tax=Pantoea stewartii subsp. stewartii DC283 TaxID=660596 RepID=A0ABM6K4Q5_PANSE|nr:hypothetical protein [Pantoea stewartii]ARF48862.1 hypothetical protein DSJ_05610 [Pantoea stewartii subsp. stewartii DC283]KAB0551632.1 hypothetical protein F7Q90_16935 [Pantoea stewartii subsp. stewartii]